MLYFYKEILVTLKEHEQQKIIKLMISNYSNSKFDQLVEILIKSTKGKNILKEFKKYEDRLNYYLSITSIYHTIYNITSIYATLAIQENDGGIKSPSSNPKAASRMRLEPFVGLLIIQFQKLAETHTKFTGIRDESIRITKEESDFKIFKFIKRIKKIKEFKGLRDGSFAHPFEDEYNMKVYRNQIIAERIVDAITKFCKPDTEEIKEKLIQLVNIETYTGIVFFQKEKSNLSENNNDAKSAYNKIVYELEKKFNDFKFELDNSDWIKNFNLLFHGFFSYYFCSTRLVIENNKLQYTTTIKNCIFMKSLYKYTEFVRANYLKNVNINLLNSDDSFNELYKKISQIKEH